MLFRAWDGETRPWSVGELRPHFPDSPGAQMDLGPRPLNCAKRAERLVAPGCGARLPDLGTVDISLGSRYLQIGPLRVAELLCQRRRRDRCVSGIPPAANSPWVFSWAREEPGGSRARPPWSCRGAHSGHVRRRHAHRGGLPGSGCSPAAIVGARCVGARFADSGLRGFLTAVGQGVTATERHAPSTTDQSARGIWDESASAWSRRRHLERDCHLTVALQQRTVDRGGGASMLRAAGARRATP
jgi:hypothetical protein